MMQKIILQSPTYSSSHFSPDATTIMVIPLSVKTGSRDS